MWGAIRRCAIRMSSRLGNEETALPEQLGVSENLSQRGIYFETTVPLKIGMLLEVILRMPYELFGRLTTESKCLARVVRVKEDSAAGKKSGIGLHIERYEAA